MLINSILMFATNFYLPLQCFYSLNCTISGTLRGRVYKTKIKDVHELRERIVERVIDKVAGKSRKRLRACVVAGGGQLL